MKNLEDYLQPRIRRKTPVMLSESPLLSPDTTQALENAEKLVKEAQKQIIEASYDIASSPERENSIGSGREKKTDFDDAEEALYIRDIVSTRFHEANETARIFTRSSTRPLAERVSRPEVHRIRGRRHGERSVKIRQELPTTSRRKTTKNSRKSIEEIQNSFSSERPYQTKEKLNKISKENSSIPGMQKNAYTNADREQILLFKVQEGPRVDIRNDFTITNVENLDISPQPISALPVKINIKTYEFRHESCEKINVDSGLIEIDVNARESPEVTEKSRDQLRKNPEAVPAPSLEGSRSDLVINKSGRSILPERLEGRVDNVTAKISELKDREIVENAEIRGESFIDFLRRSANDQQHFKEDEKAKILKNRVIGALNTNDKINIFNRAVEEFFEEFKRPDRDFPVIGFARENRNRDENLLLDRDAIDGADLGNFGIEKKTDNLRLEVFDDDTEIFENWEEVNLEPPNFGDIEKTVLKFEGTIDKVTRGARSLGVLISQYSIEENHPQKSVTVTTDQRLQETNRTLFCSTSIENHKIPSKDTDLFNEKSIEKSAVPRREASREAKISKEIGTKLSAKLVHSHPRFSTPLKDGTRFENFGLPRDESSSNDFARFFVGIQKPIPRVDPENPMKLRVTKDTDFSASDKKNELLPEFGIEKHKKIVLEEIDRNCNFDALFNRDRRSNTENEEKTNDTDTIATYDVPEKKGSMVQDSAIGRTTDRSDDVSLGTKLIDERSTRKASSRSEQSAPAMRSDKSSTKQNLSTEKLIVKNKSVESANVKKIEIYDERKSSECNELSKKKSVQSQESSDKNRQGASASSSPRDRTSFDVSTAYSEDFEEPIVTEKSKYLEKIEESKKSIFNENEAPATIELINKDTNDKTEQSSYEKSLESTKFNSESKRDDNYIEKSVSISVNKSSDKNEKDTKKLVFEPKETLKNNSVSNKTEPSGPEKSNESKNKNVKDSSKSDSESKEIVKNNSVTKKVETNGHDESDESGNNRECAASSSASTKTSGTSSLAGEPRRETIRIPKESNEDESNVMEINRLDTEKTENSVKKSDNYNDVQEENIENQTEEKNNQKSEEFELNESPSNNFSSKSQEFHEPNTKLKKNQKYKSSIIHSTPKDLFDNSIAPNENLGFPFSDPIPNDEQTEEVTTDTCSENYSEGEIYLGSSCSYSLGEIRISEHPKCHGNVDAGIIESLEKYTDEIRIFFNKNYSTINSLDNANEATNRATHSPGEVEETDVESVYSSRGLSSDSDNRQTNQLAARS